MEEPGGHGRGVHLELDEEAGHGQGVDVVRLAGDPPLPPVHLLGELVGAAHEVDVAAGLVAGDLGQEVAQRPHLRVPAGPRGGRWGGRAPAWGSGPTTAG